MSVIPLSVDTWTILSSLYRTATSISVLTQEENTTGAMMVSLHGIKRPMRISMVWIQEKNNLNTRNTRLVEPRTKVVVGFISGWKLS